MPGNAPPSPSPSPRRIDFEIDHKNFEDWERRYRALCQVLPPQSDGDRLLLWRASVLSQQDGYSEHWLQDSIAGVEATKPANKFAYLTKCLRENAKPLDRDFSADSKFCPPLPKTLKPPPPSRNRKRKRQSVDDDANAKNELQKALQESTK